MSKDTYKFAIKNYVRQLIVTSGNADQVINALTDVALDFLDEALEENRKERDRLAHEVLSDPPFKAIGSERVHASDPPPIPTARGELRP